MAHQLQLAALMRTSQQTISRWESGTSRPRDKQIPRLAAVLCADSAELLAAAGYTTRRTVSTLDQAFPLEALNPESFERFCFYFLGKFYPDAKVHRVGKSGHSQEGVDIDVVFPDETSYTFQCKRVERLGPEKVQAAVVAHTRKSRKKFLLLSRVASPNARQEIGRHKNWDIWDKEDISHRIRNLPKDEQRRLVDIFFRGQRLALLGETEPGPWQTAEEFFAPFTNRGGAFSHSWNLVGRAKETSELLGALTAGPAQIVFLVGPGGTGKSRILKEVIADYESRHLNISTRFLSSTQGITNKDLEDLGGAQKLLVIDDAHDRTDLPLLFQWAGASPQIRLLLSLRPYGLDYIKGLAGTFALSGDRIASVIVTPFSFDDAKGLAVQVLEAFKGAANHAEAIARATQDCPLATVIVSQIVAKKGIHFELAKNEEGFRSTFLGKFREVIAGSIGNKNDARSVKELLKIIALLQPIHPDDQTLTHIVGRVTKLQPHEFKRLIRVLVETGVLFKRGAEYRLSPDMLADFIIEDVCIGPGGESSGFAELIFDEANDQQIEHLLVNLGKLDWRLSNGDPTRSQLLGNIWSRLQPAVNDSAPRVGAVAAVAYYQPTRALDFAERLVGQGRSLRDLPTLIKNAAYSYKHLPRACEYLWELGKADSADFNQNPGHAVRILSELCAAELYKPIVYNETVVDFALSLLSREESWIYHYSPFDILKGIARTEGHESTSDGRSISLTPFHVIPKAVSTLRKKIVDATLALIPHSNLRIGVLAARFLHEMLRYPMGVLGASVESTRREEWTEEFARTLNSVESLVQGSALSSIVLLELFQSVSWHAHYAQGETSPIANRILNSAPQSLEFRTTCALMDGYGRMLKWGDNTQQQWNSYLQTVTKDLLSRYPHGETLRAVLEQQISAIEAYCTGRNTAPQILYWYLIKASLSLAEATAQNALAAPASRTKRFAGMALSKIFSEKPAEGIVIAQRFLAEGSPQMYSAVADAYQGLNARDLCEEGKIALLRDILASRDSSVVQNAMASVRIVSECDKRLAIDLVKSANFASKAVADDALMLFHADEDALFKSLTEEDLDVLLDNLMSLSELDGFWIDTFLSSVSVAHPDRALDFLMERVDHAAKAHDWGYRPCNDGPFIRVPLRFRRSANFTALFHRVSKWIESRPLDDRVFHYWASKLLEILFQPFDDELVTYLQDWTDSATRSGICIISQILAGSDEKFIFEQRPFVIKFLERSKQFGDECFKRSIAALRSSAEMALRSGKVGEPFPVDIEMKQLAEKAIEITPRFSPAYELYDAVKRRAEENIRQSLQDPLA